MDSKPTIIRIPKLTVTEWFLLLVPMFRFLRIELVGQLYLAETVTILAIVYYALFARSVKVDRTGLVIVFLASIWLVVQIVTDLYLGISTRDMLRGNINILFVILGIVALLLLDAGSYKKMSLFVIGWSIGGIFKVYVMPLELHQTDPIKWGVGPAVLFLGLVLLSHTQRKHTYLAAFGLVVLVVWCLVTSNRALALIAMGTFVVYALSGHMNVWLGKGVFRKGLVGVPIVAATLLLSLGTFQLYGMAVQSGVLGERALGKHTRQVGSDLGFILSARSEILISSLAVFESPIVGRGSWAKDEYLASIYAILREATGQGAREVEAEPGIILTHSYLMGAWVHAGIYGAFFWIIMFAAFARIVLSQLFSPNKADILVTFLMVFTCWNILFSNLNGESRYMTELCFSILIYQLANLRRPKVNMKTPGLPNLQTA
jgi:hypothetical protein